MPEEHKHEPDGQPKKPRLRKDLLTSAEAKEEYHRRLTNVVPDLPALVVVVIMGGIGAAVASWWKLSIGETQFAATVASLPLLLKVFLGSLGATAAVFLLAKTDTSKLIHCGLIAILSGMAGPYLVTKALNTVISVKPEELRIGGAITVVKSSTEKLRKEIENQTPNTNPQKIVDVVDQAARATSTYLATLKDAPKAEKQLALAGTKQQLQETLNVLNTAATVVPKQSLPLISNVLKEAQDAGATDVAQQAQKIIETNPAVQTAVQSAELSGKVYFITPAGLTDVKLQDLHNRIKERFPLADIQPPVHPKGIDSGIEVVYYRDLPMDQQNANALANLVANYFQEQKIAVTPPKVRRGSTDQVPPPFQFDIHIGPDITSKFITGR